MISTFFSIILTRANDTRDDIAQLSVAVSRMDADLRILTSKIKGVEKEIKTSNTVCERLSNILENQQLQKTKPVYDSRLSKIPMDRSSGDDINEEQIHESDAGKEQDIEEFGKEQDIEDVGKEQDIEDVGEEQTFEEVDKEKAIELTLKPAENKKCKKKSSTKTNARVTNKRVREEDISSTRSPTTRRNNKTQKKKK
ncbi:hypothetical protein BDC45DRAFT_537517 [Circinella umbellata]|nr:hypothetical protein BDC45DRAFT_537517 [Circinella umbellata]